MKTTLWILKCFVPAMILFVATLILYGKVEQPYDTYPAPQASIKVLGPFWGLSVSEEIPLSQLKLKIIDMKKWAKTAGAPCDIYFGKVSTERNGKDGDHLSRGGCLFNTSVKPPQKLDPHYSIQSFEKARYFVVDFDGNQKVAQELAKKWLKENGYQPAVDDLRIYRSRGPMQAPSVQYLYKAPERKVASTFEMQKTPSAK